MATSDTTVFFSLSLDSVLPSNPMEKTTMSGQVRPASVNHDTEKMAGVHQSVNPSVDDKASLSSQDSANFQGGVQRVRAITSAWSTKTLVLMFIL